MKINEHILRKIIREALNEMVAYHGGARKFGAFDLSKAHTGEGGTMYGYGVYVTTNPNTAKYYMNISARGQGAGYLYEVQIPDDVQYPDIKDYMNYISVTGFRLAEEGEMGLQSKTPDVETAVK